MHPFAYAAPDTVEEALDLLRRHGDEAKVLAGGQSLVPLLAYRLARPRLVVDLDGLPLGQVAVAGGRLHLGALVRYHDLEASAAVARHAAVLGEAAALVGNVRVRSLGTVGGSLAHADPAAELPMALLALDARLVLVSAAGRRVLPAAEFFRGVLATALAPGELVAGVEVASAQAMGGAVEELARRAGDFAVTAATALVRLDRRGLVEDARVALAGVADRPVRAPAAEDLLRGHEPTPERIVRAAEAARAAVDPPSDAFASGAYRRLLAGVLTRRALARAVARAPRRGTGPGEHGPSGDEHRGAPAAVEAPAPTGLRTSPARAWPISRGDSGPIPVILNGRPRELPARPHQTLLEALRDALGIFDVKEGCGEGVCGACTVLLDGRPVSSCLVLAPAARGRAVVTVRGLQPAGGLHPLQEAFVRHGAVQCGFCTPGMLLTAWAFVQRHPRPGREAIRRALEGNLCRCTGYAKILDAVEAYVRAGAPGAGREGGDG